MEMHQWFLDELSNAGREFVPVYGTPGQRVEESLRAVDPLIHFEVLPESREI